MSDITELHNVLRKIIIMVHDAGGFAELSDVSKNLDHSDFGIVRKSCYVPGAADKDALLLPFLRKYPEIFYVGPAQGRIIMSLSRRFAYFYPRIASALMQVSDPKRESIIRCASRIQKNPPKHLQNNGRFFEYEFAKASLAVLEILDTISSYFKRKRGQAATKKVFEVLVSKIGPLGAAVLGYCSPDAESLESGFLCFAKLFPKIFHIAGPRMSVDLYCLEFACVAAENDLYWSYVGVCLTRGITKFSELFREVTGFVRRAKLRNSDMWNQGMLDSFLRIQREMCFYPGDGNVYLMNPCLGIPEHRLELIEEFFLVHVSGCGRKGLHYKDCYNVLKRIKPRLLEGHEDETAITIACHLFSMSNVFEIDHGHFKLSQQWYGPQYEMLQVEAPTTVFRPVRLEGGEQLYDGLGVGYVKDVGIRSAVLILEGPLVHSEDFVLEKSADVFAFCHVDLTLFSDEPIDDFTKICDFGDFVKFMFDTNETVSITSPFYVNVFNIFYVGVSERTSSSGCRRNASSSSSSVASSSPKTPEKCLVPFEEELSARPETGVTVEEDNVVCSEKNDGSADENTAKVLDGALRRRAAVLYDLRRHCPQCRKPWTANAVFSGVLRIEPPASGTDAGRVESQQTLRAEPDVQEVVRPNIEERVPRLYDILETEGSNPEPSKGVRRLSINVGYSVRGEKMTVPKPCPSTPTLSRLDESHVEIVKLPTKDYRYVESVEEFSAPTSAGSKEHKRPRLQDKPHASGGSKVIVAQPAYQHNASAKIGKNLTRRGSQLLLRIIGWMKVLSELGTTDIPEIKNGTECRSLVVDEIEEANRSLHLVNPMEDIVHMLIEYPGVTAVTVPKRELVSDSDVGDESASDDQSEDDDISQTT